MAGETTITVIGNLTADPELRYTSSGIPVCSFRVASTPRVRNRQTGEWSDGDPLFLGCELWREAAENAGESLKKGMRVIVQGNLTQRSYQTQSGEQRTVFELKNCEVGPSLFRARAQVTRNERGGGGYGGGGGYQGGAGGLSGRFWRRLQQCRWSGRLQRRRPAAHLQRSGRRGSGRPVGHGRGDQLRRRASVLTQV